mgnify:CR=1 FL=1
MSLERYFTAYDEWRNGALDALESLARTLESLGVANEVFRSRLDAARERLREECLRLAFVAEFSRGKSELINALVFSSLGARALPSRSGRTTMCPTELGYDPEIAPCLRLLPIETRLQPQGLAEWRLRPEHWVQLALDVNDADQVIWYAPANLGWDLAASVAGSTVPTEVCDSLEAIIAGVKAVAAPGTQVVIMSNGGFGGLHGKLASALAE